MNKMDMILVPPVLNADFEIVDELFVEDAKFIPNIGDSIEFMVIKKKSDKMPISYVKVVTNKVFNYRLGNVTIYVD